MAGRMGSLVALVLMALLASCTTARPALVEPTGFAEYSGGPAYRAVSPEGVVLRVRLVENDPPQTLEFWIEALKTQLVKSGYILVGEEQFEAPAGKGTLLEWSAPVGEGQWIYLTGLAVTSGGIAVSEAAGAYEDYRRRREAIVQSIRTLEVR